jgi:hypothetical protein
MWRLGKVITPPKNIMQINADVPTQLNTIRMPIKHIINHKIIQYPPLEV